MNPIDLELKYPDPQFSYSLGAKTLVVVLHAFLTTRKNMANPIAVVRATYLKEGKGGVDIYAPTLPYKHWWDRAAHFGRIYFAGCVLGGAAPGAETSPGLKRQLLTSRNRNAL